MSIALELIRADAEHQSALGNLLELYMHDFSELVPLDVGDDGRYGYKNLPLFWSDNSRLSFLARLDGKIVGIRARHTKLTAVGRWRSLGHGGVFCVAPVPASRNRDPTRRESVAPLSRSMAEADFWPG